MKKANKTVIGVFVVGAVALFVTAIAVFGSGTLFKQSDKYIIYFDKSVKGLSVGSPVICKGVKIGNVSAISLIYNPKTEDVIIPVIIDVSLSIVKGVPETFGYTDFKTLIEQGLRGKLEIQNFITAQLMISLDFYPDNKPKYYGFVKKYPELPAIPTSPDIFETMNEIPIKEISKNLDEVVSGINKLVHSGGFYVLGDAVQGITQAARSMKLLTDYLERHPEALLKGKELKGD